MTVSLTAPLDLSDNTNIPQKSILRYPSSANNRRKATDAHLDDSLVLSPGKKAKVSFANNSESVIMDESFLLKVRNIEVVKEEVKRAINAHLKGDSHGYDRVIAVFRPNKINDEVERVSSEELKSYLIALTSSASLLSSACSLLIKNILSMEWVIQEEVFVKAYVLFLGNLASAQGTYVVPILEMLISYFLGVQRPSNELESCPKLSQAELLLRVHIALRYILRLIPSASSALLPICAKRFPLTSEKKLPHISYVENLIQLIKYAPELRLDILALITDRLIKIDVQIQVDLDDLDEEVTSSIVHKLSNKRSKIQGDDTETDTDDDDDENDDQTDSDSETESTMSDDDLSLDSKRAKEMRENVEKMDLTLDILFTIYNPYFTDPDSAKAVSMFETLLSHFANIILPAYRSRHTQFILFHFAQRSEHLVDQFAGTCVQLAFNPGQPDVLKQAAAAYLASFIARGAYIRPQIVQTVFDLIGSYLDNIREENELHCLGPDLKRYGTFYALTQALLYIFCFRWRDLISSSKALEDDESLAILSGDFTWIPGIKEIFSRTIYSKLNPLKVCSPSIVAEFAKIAHHLKFMYVFPLLETNKRVRLGQFSLANRNSTSRDAIKFNSDNKWHQLDAYFPFDPYQLPVSKRWVDGDYIEWKGIPGLHNDENNNVDYDENSDDTGDTDLDDIN